MHGLKTRATGGVVSIALLIGVICSIGRANDEHAKSIPISAVEHAGPVDFQSEVLPILRASCLACHNKTKAKAKLVLETPADIRKGGDSGPAVVAGKGNESLLLKAAAHDPSVDSPMPPPENKVNAAPLTPQQLGLIRLWIDQGATGDVSQSESVVWRQMPLTLRAIYAVAISPDGRLVACGRANEILLYQIRDGRLVARLLDPTLAPSAQAAHRDMVESLAFSPDGRLLASGSYREVKLWRGPGPMTRFVLPGGMVAVSYNGKMIATSRGDGLVHLWNRDGAPIQTLSTDDLPIDAIRFSADAQRVIAYCGGRSTCEWEIGSGRPVAASAAAANHFVQPRIGLTFSPDGSLVAVAVHVGRLRICDTETGLELGAIEGVEPSDSIRLVDDQRLIVGRSGDESVSTVWELCDSWRLASTIGGDSASSTFADRVTALDFSPNGTTLAMGGGQTSRAGEIVLWDLAANKISHRFDDIHSDAVLSLRFSPDGRRLASGAADKVLRVTDPSSGNVLHSFEGHTHHVLGVAWRRDGHMIASSGADGTVRFWNPDTGERKAVVSGFDKEVTGVSFLGDADQIVAVSGDPRVRIIHDDGGDVRSLDGGKDFIYCVAASRDGRIIAAGGQDGVLRVWDAKSGRLLFSAPDSQK